MFIFWIIITVLHLVGDSFSEMDLCTTGGDIALFRRFFVDSYWTLITRNLVIITIIFSFQIYVSRKQHYMMRVMSTAGEHQSNVIDDFDVLLESVLPHKLFQNYLRTFYPDYMPYLIMVRKAKLILTKREELDYLLMKTVDPKFRLSPRTRNVAEKIT